VFRNSLLTSVKKVLPSGREYKQRLIFSQLGLLKRPLLLEFYTLNINRMQRSKRKMSRMRSRQSKGILRKLVIKVKSKLGLLICQFQKQLLEDCTKPSLSK